MIKGERLLGFVFTNPEGNRDEAEEYELRAEGDDYAVFERRGFYRDEQVSEDYHDPLRPIACAFAYELRHRVKSETLQDDGRRFMRREVGRYLETRYAIYERGGTLKFPKDYGMDDVILPDTLIFTCHDEKEANEHWRKIKNMPVKERKTADIQWLDE